MTTTKKLTKEAARKAARARLAGQQAEARRRAEEEAARLAAIRREADTLNEEAMADYFQCESAIEAARAELDRVEALSTIGMGVAISDIAGREGSVSAAARLLGITPAVAKKYVSAAGAAGTTPEATDSSDGETPANEANSIESADAGVVSGETAPAALSA